MNNHAEKLSNLQGASHAARILGSLGGKSGKGEAKARPSAQCRQNALKSWTKEARQKRIEARASRLNGAKHKKRK